MTPEQRRICGKLAARERHYPEDRETADALRRDLRASRAEDYVRELVDAAPPLSPEQRARLAALLSVDESSSAA